VLLFVHAKGVYFFGHGKGSRIIFDFSLALGCCCDRFYHGLVIEWRCLSLWKVNNWCNKAGKWGVLERTRQKAQACGYLDHTAYLALYSLSSPVGYSICFKH
jgi:hypothetical protein